ncbi:DUF5655 domain-containing protein [Balneolaceae bacterium ANBcel3]|nr:DUF5655 domain-containing protein [Balneolaceae bacterium ANBcel3]
MPLFKISEQKLSSVEQSNFATEKELQELIERNLEAVFNCRFVASEFPTGSVHSGRIDTLALSEDLNPVIIEYKKVESSELINQSLYYLSWINDHRGDYEIAVQKALGNNIEIDWSDVRVICIAPNYKKYDLHAVQVMGANIELWSYRLFNNGSIYFEEVRQKSFSTTTSAKANSNDKNPVMVEAGRKAALTRASATYTYDQHIENKPEKIKELAQLIQEFMMGLDPSIEEIPKKYYVAYRISQNIACVELQKKRLILYLKLNPADFDSLPEIARDVTKIGHYGTGDLEFTIRSEKDFEIAKSYIEKAYQKVGS